MKKLLTVGLILSLSIGSAQAYGKRGSFQPTGPFQQSVMSKVQIEKMLKQAQQQATQAVKEVKKLQRAQVAQDILNVAQTNQRRTQQLVNKYKNKLNQVIGSISPF